MRVLLFTLTLILSSITIAQEAVLKPRFIKNEMDSLTAISFNSSLQAFFSEMAQGEINDQWLTADKAALTKSQLQELANYEIHKDSSVTDLQDKQLINLYPISANQYFISISYCREGQDSNPILFYVINLIATKEKDKFTFSVPLDYFTRYWKTQTVGNITYHFRGEIKVGRAKLFDEKNTEIANKMGLSPEKMDFYMCDDFQEISKLLGFEYSVFSNGKYRDGYGVDSKTIFAIQNNEDFSHDIFHYYSSQINDRSNRNWVTEEGIAYLWGNAYYTDQEGEMITHERLVEELKKYLKKNSEADLYHLFEENVKLFNDIAPEISVRSTISGIIAKEVEAKHGMDGIMKLINAGRKDKVENYLRVTNELLKINKENFNLKVKELIDKY